MFIFCCVITAVLHHYFERIGVHYIELLALMCIRAVGISYVSIKLQVVAGLGTVHQFADALYESEAR